MFGFLSADATDPTTPRSAATAISNHKLLLIKVRFTCWFLCVLVVWICTRGRCNRRDGDREHAAKVCFADFIGADLTHLNKGNLVVSPVSCL